MRKNFEHFLELVISTTSTALSALSRSQKTVAISGLCFQNSIWLHHGHFLLECLHARLSSRTWCDSISSKSLPVMWPFASYHDLGQHSARCHKVIQNKIGIDIDVRTLLLFSLLVASCFFLIFWSSKTLKSLNPGWWMGGFIKLHLDQNGNSHVMLISICLWNLCFLLSYSC